MAGINFVILKINGIDVTDIPHEEAVQIFLKAPEPILVEVRRRLNDSQQQSIKKPSTPNHEISEKSKDQNSDLKTTILQPPLSSSSSSSIPPPPLPLQLSDNDDNQNIRVIESPIKSIRTDNLLESSNTQTLVPSHTNIVQHQTKIFKNHNNDSCYNVGTSNSSGSCIYKGGVNMGGMGGIGNVNGTSSTAASATAVIENDKKNDEKTITSIANATAAASSSSQNDTYPNNTNNSCCSKCYVSTAVQTDIFTSEFIFNSSSIDDQTNEDNIFEECLAPEIDIEEITLRKSVSNERLGLTVKYNSGNASGSDDTDTCTEVYISDIMPDSVAARDGRLRQGDQILQVNGRDVSNKEETESLIAENKNAVTLLVSRCLYTDDDFNESGEFYDDEEQQIAYENYAIEQQQFLVDNNHSLDNVSQEQTNTSSTKSSSSPKNTNTIIDKSQNPSYQQDELISILSATDPLHHANIKAHLESVNNEIALLNTRVENMMLHKKPQNEYSSGNQNLNSVYRVPMDSITPPSVPLNESPTNRINSCTVDDEKISKYSRNRIIDSDTEHIYETIPESSESEPFYCSPYESSDQNLVEKWLETQQNSTLDRCNKKRIQQIKLTTQKNSIWQKTSTKSNSSGDDRENSSSAYNTGGSCNSNNQLTLELNSNDDPRGKDIMRSTLTLCPPQKSELDNKQIFQQEISDGCKQCQRQKKEKNSPKRIIPFVVPQQNFQIQPQQQQQQICSSYPLQNIQRSRSNEQTIGSNCSTLRANEDGSRVGKTFVSNTAQIPADTMYTNRANLHQTMLLQQKLFRQALLQQNQQNTTQVRTHFTAPNLSQYYFVSGQEVATVSSKPIDNDVKMEWKVKRRQDGTRYIVRRPTRNRILRDRAMKISEERNECTTEDDTISEIKTGRYWTKEERKKHIERAKERRHRQQLIILNKTNNLPFSSTISNINSGNNIGCTGLSSTPIKTPAINQQIQQPPPFQVISTKPPRQSSAKNQSHQESTTLHKKILKKKNKDETVETNKQIPGSSNSSGSKMTGLLSVTTV